TAHSVGGEKKVGNFKLDGWVEERNLGIEVNGCAWHGCPKKSCYPDDNMMLPNGMTAGKRRLKDYERKKFILEQGIDLKIFWECEIREMLENDRDMKEKFNNYLDEGPLEIRACFFGGRTGPLKLIHEARPGEKISYFDVTSLYPFTNFNTNYPIGHPIVHTLNEEVHWTCAADNPYKLALLKVFVIPPKKIDIPVLPAKFDEESKEKSQTLTHLWKLTKGKTVLQYHLCYDCQKRLFNSQDKIIRQGDKIILKIEFCEKCALDNCQATDLLSNKPKRKYRKVEDKMDN
uniref:DNA-directed DNA polymerase n=1 Tax=Meloidogyne javanica TaxID=6303 RepID=A0A915LSZ5_MELJA